MAEDCQRWARCVNLWGNFSESNNSRDSSPIVPQGAPRPQRKGARQSPLRWISCLLSGGVLLY